MSGLGSVHGVRRRGRGLLGHRHQGLGWHSCGSDNSESDSIVIHKQRTRGRAVVLLLHLRCVRQQ